MYIRGIGNISPQNTIKREYFLEEIRQNEGEYLTCIEADYNSYIDVMQRKRLSRFLRRGITAAKMCLIDAGIEMPGAIITGTGCGSSEDTEIFLKAMLDRAEQMLNPTYFIHSTYNSISTQIAIALKCHSYNNTYVHRSFSFESALLDALLQLKDHQADHVLVGGADEVIQEQYNVTKKTGRWKDSIIINTDILKSSSPGTIAGEGSVFFLLSNVLHPHNYARIKDVSTFYKPNNNDEISVYISEFLTHNHLEPDQIDILLTGLNGDSRFDPIYYEITQQIFPKTKLTYYKHLCGEYFTSTAFALWLASNILKRQKVPQNILVYNSYNSGDINNILIWNHYKNEEHSLLLVESVP